MIRAIKLSDHPFFLTLLSRIWKYDHTNSPTYKLGCDYCLPLAGVSTELAYEVMGRDSLCLSHPPVNALLQCPSATGKVCASAFFYLFGSYLRLCNKSQDN